MVVGVLLTGGSGGPSGSSRSEYIARADGIWGSALVRAAPLVERLTATVGGSLTPVRARRSAAIVGRLHTVATAYLARLRALEQPSDDEEEIAAFLEPTARVVEAIAEARDTLGRADVVGTLALLQRARTADKEARSAARAYGFKRCGSVISAAGRGSSR